MASKDTQPQQPAPSAFTTLDRRGLFKDEIDGAWIFEEPLLETQRDVWQDPSGAWWHLQTSWAVVEGRAEPVALVIESPHGRPLRAEDMREIPLGGLFGDQRKRIVDELRTASRTAEEMARWVECGEVPVALISAVPEADRAMAVEFFDSGKGWTATERAAAVRRVRGPVSLRGLGPLVPAGGPEGDLEAAYNQLLKDFDPYRQSPSSDQREPERQRAEAEKFRGAADAFSARGGRATKPSELAKVAAAYRLASLGGENVKRAVMLACGLRTESGAAKRIKAARDAGQLGPARTGKAGERT